MFIIPCAIETKFLPLIYSEVDTRQINKEISTQKKYFK